MIKTDNVTLRVFDDPFRFFHGGPLLSDTDLIRLNSELPERDLYRREIKVGLEHKKQYNMWRCEVFADHQKTAAAAQLPSAWSELLDSLIADEFPKLAGAGDRHRARRSPNDDRNLHI